MRDGPIKGLKRAGPTNMVEQELADLLNDAARKDSYEALRMVDPSGPPMWPMPPHNTRAGGLTPPNFDPNEEETPWDFITRIAPDMTGRSEWMHYGPTPGAIEALADSGFHADQMDRTSLLGMTDLGPTKEIGLNPNLDIFGLRDPVVAHEMAHTVGVDHDRNMKNIEGLMRMAREYQRRNQK